MQVTRAVKAVVAISQIDILADHVIIAPASWLHRTGPLANVRKATVLNT